MNKDEKQPKPKKTSAQKGLIASMIAAGCLASVITSAIPGLIVTNDYDRDIKDLDEQQSAIYQEFMGSGEFSKYTDEQIIQLVEDYSSSKINHIEFRARLKKLFTLESAKQVLETSNNTELKQQVEDIEAQKKERSEEYDKSIIPELSVGGAIAFDAGALASAAASVVYNKKALWEERRKEREAKRKQAQRERNNDNEQGL